MSAQSEVLAQQDKPSASAARRSIRCGKRFWKQGEPLVWATGAALTTVLLMAATLVTVVLVNGLGVFWPSAVAEMTLADGSVLLGQPVRSEVNPATDQRRTLYKLGNRELGEDFRWIDDPDVVERSYPAEAFQVERTSYGDFFGRLEDLQLPTLDVPESASPAARLHAALQSLEQVREAQVEPLADQLTDLSRQLQHVRDAILRLEYRHKRIARGEQPGDLSEIDAQLATLKAEDARIIRESDSLREEKSAIERELAKNVALFRTAAGEERTLELVGIVRPYQPNAMGLGSKVQHYAGKVWELLTAEPRESNTEGGLFPAIFGTVMLVFLMSILCFPLGVLAGVYLGEYAREGAMVRVVRIAVNNLAGIPSIVYGIFGLGFFVHGIGGLVDQWFYPEYVDQNKAVFGTDGILWASLTLGILTVPVVIVSTEEALRTIPRGIREGSYALGATKFQTLLRVLLPMASPGVMTGFILAMARAAGEVAPLMITGVVKLAPQLPLDGDFPYFHVNRQFMHLGFHIFDIGYQSPNVEATRPMVFVTTFLLVAIVLAMSSVAIYLRNRMRKRFQTRSI